MNHHFRFVTSVAPATAMLALAVALLPPSTASATPVEPINKTISWQGIAPNYSGVWGEASLWDPAEVPDNTDEILYDVVIGETPNIGPSLQSGVTINSLTLIDGRGMSNNTGNPADLTVLTNTSFQPYYYNTVPMYGGIEIRESTYTLGDFDNLDNDGIFSMGVVRIEGSGQTAALRFKNANILENRADISFFRNAFIEDQDTGENALRNLQKNAGQITVDAGAKLTTNGDLENSGYLTIYGGDLQNINNLTTLTINGNLTNTGTLDIRGYQQYGAGKVVVDGDLTNSGHIQFEGNSTILEVTGAFKQTSGTLFIGDISEPETFRMTAARIDMAAGTTLGGRGTVFADLVEGGIFAPGASPGRIEVQGDITMLDTAELQIEIGGTAAGTEYDQVAQITQPGGSGTTLDGLLTVSFVNGFETSIGPGDTFTILTSDQLLAGAFNNIASGSRLATADGFGSFLVSYNGSQVILSNYAVPEPGTMSLLLASATLLIRRKRFA